MRGPFSDIELELKKGFRELFPDCVRRLERATSDAEVAAIRHEMIAAEIAGLRGVVDDAVLDDLAQGKGVDYVLTNTQYRNLIGAQGNDIKVQIQTLLNSLKVLKQLKDPTDEDVASQLLASGVGAISHAVTIYLNTLARSIGEVRAALAGVRALSAGGVVGIVTIVVITTLIPILFFMLKPAACVVLVLNELTDTDLDLGRDGVHNLHGETAQTAPKIRAAGRSVDGDLAPVMGLVVSHKHPNALVGTQSGFVYGAGATDLAFGVECPLTSIYVDNNCWCGIGATAKHAVERTNATNTQSFSASDSVCEIGIDCNSGAGSVAYYRARVRAKTT